MYNKIFLRIHHWNLGIIFLSSRAILIVIVELFSHKSNKLQFNNLFGKKLQNIGGLYSR